MYFEYLPLTSLIGTSRFCKLAFCSKVHV